MVARKRTQKIISHFYSNKQLKYTAVLERFVLQARFTTILFTNRYIMKKFTTLLLCLLASTAFLSCDDDKSNTKSDDNTSKPANENQNTGNENQNTGNENQNTGNENQNTGNENQNTGNENQNTGNENQNTGNENQSGDLTGKACSKPVAVNEVIYDCDDDTLTYKVYQICPTGMIGYVDEDNYADCYQPCTKDDVDKTAPACYVLDDVVLAGPMLCIKLDDEHYVYTLDKYEGIDYCSGGCTNGECDKLTNDEGNPCDGTFVERCDGNILVYCSEYSDTVKTSQCDEYEEDNLVCRVAKDGSGADCVVNEVCDEPGSTKSECDQTYGGLYVYNCETATDGKNYYYTDYEKSDEYCESCNAEKGICEDY